MTGNIKATSPLWWHRWRATSRRVTFVTFINIWTCNFLKKLKCLRLKNGLYKSCRYQSDLQLCSWNFFQLRLFWHTNTWFKFWISNFQNFQMTSYEKNIYMKVVDRDQIYNFVVERIFIWDRYSCEMGYIRYLKVRIKEKYLIVGQTCLAKLLK